MTASWPRARTPGWPVARPSARAAARIFAIVAMATIGSCATDRPRGTPSALREGDVARVGEMGIPGSLVGSVAGARGVGTRDALDALIEDALFAIAARDRRLQGTDANGGARWTETAALSRRALERIARDAHEAGPPSDDELATLTVVHAVVLRSTILSDGEAAGLASAIRDAVAGSADASDFEKRVSGVAHRNARVVVERLSPFGADGVMAAGGILDPAFVAAAFALRAPNETSPVVETSFGWHVIRAIERRVPEGETLNRRREDLAVAVMTLRERMARRRVLDSWRARERVEVAGPAVALLATVQVESE
jgi:hypothetical protein